VCTVSVHFSAFSSSPYYLHRRIASNVQMFAEPPVNLLVKWL